REHVDNGAAAVGTKHGRKGSAHFERTKVVRFHFSACSMQGIVSKKAGSKCNSGIVHEQRHVHAAPSRSAYLLAVRHVELDRFDTFSGTAAGVARGGIDLSCSSSRQGASQRQA